MAGIAALINTRLGAAQGNLNPLLYQLAASYPGAFHDTTIASSGVSGCTTMPSMCNNSTPGPSGLSGGLAGFSLTTGYDQATGLGSVDVANLISAAVIATSATYSITPASTSLTVASGATTGNTDGITVTSTGFAGAVNLSCTVTAITGNTSGTCSLQPNSVSLTSGSSSPSILSLVTPANTSGTLSVTVTGTSGGIVVTSPTVQVTVTGPTFTLSPANQTLTFTSGATSGNTNAVMVASMNGFTGNVTVGCTISTGSAFYQPTCSVANGVVSIAPLSNGTVTVIIGSTTAVTAAHGGLAQASLGGWGNWRFGLAGTLLLTLGLLPLRRRHRWLPLAMLLLAAGLLQLSGCGKNGSTSPAPVTHSSAGTYVVTVTGTGMTAGSSTPVSPSPMATFTVTVN
jgi:hypothetical protein